MALTELTSDLNIIAALSDEPNDTDGLTAAQLKAKFDEAGNTIKTYLNETLLDELQGVGGAAAIGVDDYNGAFSGYTNVQQILEFCYDKANSAIAGQLGEHSVENKHLSRKTDLDGAAVKAENIAAGAVDTTELADEAVTTAKIDDGAVTDAKTDFSAGLAPAGPLVLTSDVHYFASAGDLPNDAVTGQLAFVKV